MASSATNSFVNLGVQSIFPGEEKAIPVAIAPSVVIARGTLMGEIQLSDIYSLATGSQGSGTFTLTFGGVTTAAQARTVSAANLQTALRALSSIGSGNVSVVLASGTPATDGVYTITFTGTLVFKTNGALTADFSSLATPSNASLTHSVTGQLLGTYKAYSDSNTDGSQVARGVCQFDVATDASSNITFGGAATGGPYQQTSTVCPMLVKGTFSTGDLTGLDAAAVTDLGRLIEGTVTTGQLRIA